MPARSLVRTGKEPGPVVRSERLESEEVLVRAVQRRDQRALAELVQRHGGWAARFAERVTGSAEIAEEVVQSAFLRVWENAERWKGEARFSTWFYRIIHNLSIDQIRKRRIGFELLDDSVPDPGPSVEDAIDGERRAARVREALARLPERQRIAIVLSHYEECSQRDAADIMGISESALESLLVRARIALREILLQEIDRG